MSRQPPPTLIDLPRRIKLHVQPQIRCGCRAASTREESQLGGDRRLVVGKLRRETFDPRPDRDRLRRRQRTRHPEAVPARACGWKQLAQFPFARTRPLDNVGRQRHEAKAPGQPGVLDIGNPRLWQQVGRTAAARSPHCVEAAVHRQRSFDVKSTRRTERVPLAHASFTIRLASRPRPPQLPLDTLGIRTILQTTNRATKLQRPQQKRWSQMRRRRMVTCH
jgi:hypothetical protein